MSCDEAEAAAALTAANAAGPASVSGDAGSVTQHPLMSQIEYEKFQLSKCAARSPRRKLHFTRLIPPGSV